MFNKKNLLAKEKNSHMYNITSHAFVDQVNYTLLQNEFIFGKWYLKEYLYTFHLKILYHSSEVGGDDIHVSLYQYFVFWKQVCFHSPNHF